MIIYLVFFSIKKPTYKTTPTIKSNAIHIIIAKYLFLQISRKIIIDFFNPSHNKRLVLLSRSISVLPEVSQSVVVRVLLNHTSEFSSGDSTHRESKEEASVKHILRHKLRIEYAANVVFIESTVFFEHLQDFFISVLTLWLNIITSMTQSDSPLTSAVHLRSRPPFLECQKEFETFF